MLDVSDVDDLMFKRRHLVPRKPTLGRGEIQSIDAAVDHVIANAPVIQQFFRVNGLQGLGGRESSPGMASRKIASSR